MTEQDSGIKPTSPSNHYATPPSRSSPDRDPDAAHLPNTERRRKRKKQIEKKPKSEPSKDESESGDGVDILAEPFQIEIFDRNVWVNLSSFEHAP